MQKALLPLLFVLIVILYFFRSASYDAFSAAIADEPAVTVSGRVVQRQVGDDSISYKISGAAVEAGGCLYSRKTLILYAEDDGIPLGSIVSVSGVIAPFSKASNEGAFDSYSYYKSLAVSAKISVDSIEIARTARLPWREWLRTLRDAVRNIFAACLDDEDAGILSAMVLGDKTLLDREVKQMYQDMGISHILAISGLHISILGMTLYKLMRRRLSLPYGVCCAVCGLVLFLFCVMSGFSVSTQRAFFSFLFYLGAEYFGRSYTTFRALLFSAVFLLLRNPLAVTQTGFLLSYSALLSMQCFAPLLRRLLPFAAGIRKPHFGSRTHSRILSFLFSFLSSFLEGIPVSAAIWLGMLPLTAYLFYQIPVVSVLLNILILPLCGILLGCSMLGGLIGLLWTGPARLLLAGSAGILHLFDLEMKLFSGASFAVRICGCPRTAVVVLFYGGFFVFCLALQNLSVIRAFLDDCGLTAAAGRLRIARVRARPLLVSAAVLAAVAASDACILLRPSSASFEVKMLDVGQGDGICITASDGTCIMIDGGSSSKSEVGIYQILPFLKYNAIRKVDIWLVSHTDEDHISGLLEVLEYGYPVEVIAFSNLPEEDENYAALAEAAVANGTRVAYVCEGSSIRTPDFVMTCLYPAEDDASEDANDLSQVWLLESEAYSMLFTGDLGSEQEALLLSRGLLEEVDFLKVGHHGSNYSSSEEFLAALDPQAALISVGANNLYGHPGTETLARLSECGACVCATMDYGQLTIRVDHGKTYINGFLND